MPSTLSRGIGRAATLLKTLLQYYGKSLEALPDVAYPGFRDNRSTLNTKTGYKKKHNAHVVNWRWMSIPVADMISIFLTQNITHPLLQCSLAYSYISLSPPKYDVNAIP